MCPLISESVHVNESETAVPSAAPCGVTEAHHRAGERDGDIRGESIAPIAEGRAFSKATVFGGGGGNRFSSTRSTAACEVCVLSSYVSFAEADTAGAPLTKSG